MSKIEINKEIVLLRKVVEQARVNIVQKLSRNASQLRQKKGTDAQKAKNSRKADRIAAEILAIKKVKKDDITKQALTQSSDLKEILKNQNSEPLTRIIARIKEHKKFNEKINEFKNKYPNYMEFLGPGRKKKAKFERKEKKKLKAGQQTDKVNNTETHEKSTKEDSNNNSSADSSEGSEDEDNQDINDERFINTVKSSSEEDSDDNEDSTVTKVDEEIELQKPTKSKSVETVKTKKEPKQKLVEKKQKKVKENKDELEKKSSNIAKKTATPKIISKQAIVKKFTDILESEEPKFDNNEEVDDSDKTNMEIEKEEDPFFVTGDNETSYLSVALPKHKSIEVEDDNDNNYRNKFNKRKFSQQQNDNFFSKVPKFKNNDSRFNSRKQGSSWKDDRNNSRFKEKERMDYKGKHTKLNGENINNSTNFKNQSRGKFEDKNKNNEILHPSWQAKKKQQEVLKQGFQGKKIVFDNDA